MSKVSSGRVWPYLLGGAITMVFGFCVATVVVTSKANIQPSDTYMTYYQNADAKANDLIKARLNFDKKYKVSFVSEGIGNGKAVKYQVTDLKGNPINDAKLILAISRPETSKFNKKLEVSSIKNGVYSFNGIKFPKVGLWNLIAKISIGDDYRFYNLKADTRIKEVFEF